MPIAAAEHKRIAPSQDVCKSGNVGAKDEKRHCMQSIESSIGTGVAE